MFHYYDPKPKTDDVTASVAVHECQNCGTSCETLHEVPHFDYMGCDDCLEEAMAVIARESCEHLNVRVEEHEDPNEECVRVYEEITCRDCGEELIERRGELIARKRRAA